MDSRISIKGDFIENTPFIDVVYNPSDDSRDEMVGAFIEKLDHTSSWAKIQWQTPTDLNGRVNFRIVPIPPDKIEQHISQMQKTLRVYNEFCNKNSPST